MKGNECRLCTKSFESWLQSTSCWCPVFPLKIWEGVGCWGGGSSLPSAVTQTHGMRETQRSAIYPWNSEELGHPLHSPQSFHTSQHSNDCVFACVYSLIHLKSPLCVSCVPSPYVYPSEPVRKSCFAGLVLPYVVRRHHFRVSYGQELILHCSDEGQLLRPLPARVQFFMDDLTPITTQANKGGAGWWCGGMQIRALSAGQFQTWTMCQTRAILGQAGGLWMCPLMHLYALSGTRVYGFIAAWWFSKRKVKPVYLAQKRFQFFH